MRVGLLALTLLLTGCGGLSEMHYSPSQRRGEPVRLAPPSDAVPISGARPAYTFEEAARLSNPRAGSADGLDLYRVNCAVCHGFDGRGRTLMADHFRAADAIPPTDLASSRVAGRSDGQLYWLIANGIGNMPPFGSLLSEDELWLVTSYVRHLSAS